MSKARTLANLISDNAELADGQISVAEVVGAAPTASPTFTGNIDAGDNVKIRLGDSDDLQIYHDGSNSYIKDAGSGRLILQSSSDFLISNTANTQNYIYAQEGGYVRLYHAGSTKLATTATGIDVTGNVSIPDYIVHSGDTDTFFGFSNSNQIYFQAGNSRNLDLGPVSTVFNQDSANIDFRVESNTDTHALFVDASSNTIGLGLSNPSSSYKLNVNGNIRLTGTAGIVRLEAGDTSLSADQLVGRVEMYANDASTGGTGVAGYIEVKSDDQYGVNSYMALGTRVSDGSGNPTERLKITKFGGLIQYSATGGDVILNENGADSDFRVESNNQVNMLKVDAGNDSVAINRSNGSAPLHVSGDPNDTVAPEHAYAKFTAQGLDGLAFGSFASGTYASWIQSGYTSNTYSPDWNNGYAMLLNPAGGNVGIRDTEPQVDLHVGGGGHIRSDVIGGKIGWGSGGGSPWYSYITSSNDGSQNVGLEFFTTTNAGTANINHLHMHPDNGTIFNEGSVDLDFRVESNNNTNMLKVDAGNDVVLIGSSTPVTELANAQLQIGSTFGIKTFYVNSNNVTDTGITVNQGNQGAAVMVLASNHANVGTATQAGQYFLHFYYSGNHGPAVHHVAGSNMVTFGQSANNTLTVQMPAGGNTISFLMNT